MRFCVLLLCLTACEGSLAGEPLPEPDVVQPEVDAGVVELTDQALYAGYCGSCHGPTGEGTAAAYQLRSPVRPYATDVVRFGRHEGVTFPDAMPAFSEAALSRERLERIFDFLDSVPRPADGRGLYVRFCGNCHGAQGEGGRADEALVHGAYDEPDEFEEMVREGHGGTRYRDAEEYMPSWTEAQLSRAEVAAIVAYLRTFPDPGDD